jgi:predicted O-methyltransferase YrrM
MSVGFLAFEPDRIAEYAAIGRADPNTWSMSPQEGLFLCGYLAAIRARRVVEVGTNIGHSTLYLCHALRTVGFDDAVLHSFEISDRAETARAHLRRFGYERLAHVHQCDSRGAEAARVRDAIAPIDAILIDGDHSFEGSYADFCFWSGAVRPGGLVFFHDISEEFEETYRAFGSRSVYTTLRTIEERHPGWAITRLEPPFYHNVTSMAVVQRLATAPAARVAARAEPARGERPCWERASPSALAERPWEHVQLPDVRYPVSMLQLDEFRYLYWLARDAAPDDGCIVELGPWQGGSTAVLCQGVRDRPPPRRPSRIVVFDRFVWDAYSTQFSPDVPLEPGDDMEAVFRANVAPWADLIDVRKGAIEDARWDPAVPIAILFVDAITSPAALERMWATFGPGLRPGSIVVFQDFKHYATSFLPALVPLLPGLRPVHVCRDGSSVAFAIDATPSAASLPPVTREVVDEQFERACRFFAWDPPTATALQLGWATQLLNLGYFDDAQARFERVRSLPVCAGAADAPGALADRLAPPI